MGLTLRTVVGVGVMGLAAAVWSCGGDSTTESPPDATLAEIVVTVTLEGSAQPGVAVRLYQAGGSEAVASRTTDVEGRAVFSQVSPGSYEVEVDVPPGSALSAGAARRELVAAAGSTATVTFQLVAEEPEDVVLVRVRANLTFDPADVTIEAGQTIRWESEDPMLHTVTPDGHSEWSEASLSQVGARFEHTFASAGDFSYFCAPHQSAGMTGVIRVQ